MLSSTCSLLYRLLLSISNTLPVAAVNIAVLLVVCPMVAPPGNARLPAEPNVHCAVLP